ncbi:recombinase family protein [Pseudoflavonifractor sp. 524-17]|uniref:recombinase family protein n=1 Tax=Pseudoflavonifractor sp. 524-17 TaxID=2304577 RepID=UPI001379B7B7|nr:recombinase family protein [Pseudoflavonifractor sp. 524-17]
MKIAAYCRVSTEKEEQMDSLGHQKEFFEEYAVRNGHELVRLYADEGISGTSLKKRDEFVRLMRDAKLGLFDMVVVKDVSRLARNTVDFLQSIRALKSLGVNTLFLTANMDSLGESEFVLTMFGAMAQEESANLSKRVKFGKKINAQKGRVPQRIFGYDRIDNFTLAINHKEAKVVREIFRLYTEKGLGCRTISMTLNNLGYRTKFDCEWNPRGVRRVLMNPIYSGHYVNNKYEIKDYLTGKQVRIPEEQHFHHERPEWEIVSPEMFAEAQRQLSERRTQYDCGAPFVGARYSSKHLFSTLIKCEHCGRSFCRKHYTHVNTRVYWKCVTNDQYTAERCGNTVKLEEDRLLEEIRKYISSIIQDKDTFIKEVLAIVENRRPDRQEEVNTADIERKRKRLLAKKERYQEMYANDVMTMSELKEKTASIADELKALDYSLKQYEQALAVRQGSETFVQAYMQEIERFLQLETVTNLDLRKIIDHISVNREGTVRIVLKKVDEIATL